MERCREGTPSQPCSGRDWMAGHRPDRIKRGPAKRDPKARFVLFCEGKRTEPAYFSAIGKKWTGALLSIEVRAGVGVPWTTAQEARKFAQDEGLVKGNRKRRNSFEKYDRVWAVFDRDEHERFEEAVNLCESNGIGVARSNPCFEIWLILHESDFDRPDGRTEVQKELGRLRPEYDRKRDKAPNCMEMVMRVEQAEDRAKVLLKRREAEMIPHGPPSTTVGELTKAIREADQRARRHS